MCLELGLEDILLPLDYLPHSGLLAKGLAMKGASLFLGQLAQARVRGFVLRKAEPVFGIHFTFSHYEGLQVAHSVKGESGPQ